MSMQPGAELTDFVIEKPRFMVPQAASVQWMGEAHRRAEALRSGKADDPAFGREIAARFKRFGCKPDRIAVRGFDSIDPLQAGWPAAGLYSFAPPPDDGAEGGDGTWAFGGSIRERTAIFLARSREVFDAFYPAAASTRAPDHIVHVTCTGYVSPSAPQRLVNDRAWQEKTAVTHAYHMGCYAALPAVRMATALVGQLAAAGEVAAPQVDIVHNEICTLHMNPRAHAPEQMVIHSLFADGHIKYSVVPAGRAARGFRVLKVSEQIIPDSAEDMTWVPDAYGMRMTLSREVPAKIGAQLRPFVERLLAGSGHGLGETLRSAPFAIHPGGPKIIDSVQEILELSPGQTATSKQILLDRGNMSSATLPHVWKAMGEQALPSGTVVVSLAFGPGLTIFGALLQVL